MSSGTPNLRLALQLANRAADAARKVILRSYMGRFDVSTKADQTPVTDVDREVELTIRRILQTPADAFPVLGEEYGGEAEPGYCWLVDPIDGTVSFIHHIPMFATLISLTNNGEPVVAVVDLPMLDQRYTAVAGEGSWLGKERIHVAASFQADRSIVCHGDPQQFRVSGRMALYHRLEEQLNFFRSYTDALGHCLVANGSAALMIDPDLHPWDVAAPSLLVREAGGRVRLYPDGKSGLVTMVSGSPDAMEWLGPLA